MSEAISLSVRKVVSVEVEIVPEDVLRSIPVDLLRAECSRRGIAVATQTSFVTPDYSRSGKSYKIPRDDIDEMRSLVLRGDRYQALLVMERALPSDLSGAFTRFVRPTWRGV